MPQFAKGNPGGPGRPRKADKYAAQIEATEDTIVGELPVLVQKLLKLGKGGFEQTTSVWKPAAIVTVGSGEFESPAFPEKRPDELVLVERKKTTAAPDRAAIQDLLNRILGKPATTIEGEIDHNHKIPPALEDMISKVYGDDGE